MIGFDTVLLLYKKELRCLFRDKEILVYGVLLPLVLIPTIALLMIEAGLCYMGMTEVNKTKVAIVADAASREFINKEFNPYSKRLETVQDNAAQEHLKDGTVDAVVQAKDNRLELYIVEARDPIEVIKTPINNALASACEDSIKTAIKAAHLPESAARIFSITSDHVGGSSAQPKKEAPTAIGVRMGVMLLLVLLFVETMMTAVYAMLIPVVSEIEQKTLITTMMIPGPRILVAVSKFLAGFTTTLLSAVQFTFSIVVSIVLIALVLLVQVRSYGSATHAMPDLSPMPTSSATTSSVGSSLIDMAQSSAGSHMQTHEWLALVTSEVALFVLALAVACSIFFAFSAWARSAAEAQLLVTLPTTIILVIPLVALMPDLEFSRTALCIPILNLFLLMKHGAFAWWAIGLILAESVLMIIFFIMLGDYVAAVRNNFESAVPFRRANGA